MVNEIMAIQSDDLEQKIDNVLVSPCRIDVMNKLAQSEGLSLEEIKKQMIAQPTDINDHLKKLIEDAIIKFENDRYYLTKYGKTFYKTLQEIVKRSNVV